MIKIRDRKTRKVLRVELLPGEKQYLASHNLKAAIPEAWAKVKRNGAKRWRERKERGDIGLPLNDDSTKAH